MAERDIELLFIKETLEEHGEYLHELLTAAIERKKLRDKDELLENLNWTVPTVMSTGRPILRFSFPIHGRFIEIRDYRSKNRKTMEAMRRNELWGLKRKKPKDARWYTRNVMGSLNRLIGMLQSNFSNEEIERLKTLLETRTKFHGIYDI